MVEAREKMKKSRFLMELDRLLEFWCEFFKAHAYLSTSESKYLRFIYLFTDFGRRKDLGLLSSFRDVTDFGNPASEIINKKKWRKK